MKLQISKSLLSHKGEHLRVAEGENSPIATLKSVIEIALINYSAPSDEGPAKYARYKLLQRVSAAKGTVELTAEEIAEIKTIVGKSFGTVVVGAVYDALEGVQE